MSTLMARSDRFARVGLEQVTQDASDVVEYGFPRPDEQRLSAADTTVVERRFPRTDEQRLSVEDEQEDVAECGLPRAVEQGLPHVVEQGLPDEVDANVVSRRLRTADLVERGLPLPATEEFVRPVRRRGRRPPRRPHAPPYESDVSDSEVIAVLMGDDAATNPRTCDVVVARPPCNASEITTLPGLSWKHFLHNLKHGEIEQVCMIVADNTATIAAVGADVDVGDPASDARERPKGTEPKSAHEARYLAKSLPALEAAGNPVAPLVREFIDIFPDKVPAELPPDCGVRHEIDLVPGSKYCTNILADALSRRPDYVQSGCHAVGDEDDDDCAVCTTDEVAAVEVAATTPLRDLITAAYESDASCSELVKYLREPSEAARRLTPPRIVVPLDDDLRARLIHEFHDTPSSGHLGREKTFASLSRDFYWPHMYKWVRKWVRSCEACQRVKPTPSNLPRDAHGRTSILVFVDRFSKMVHLAPVASSITASQSAALFLDTVYRHHELPCSIVSDRDPRFTAAFWTELFKRWDAVGYVHRVAPETDGQTERANRVVEDVLRSYATSFTSWSSFLPMVEFAINNATHASTGLTPFFVNFGRHPRVPALLGLERPPPSQLPGSHDDATPTSTGGAPTEASEMTADSHVNAVSTRSSSRISSQGPLTRAAARAATASAYLVRWTGPLDDSWEPREVLLADVPDCVEAYEAGLLRGATPRRA
ncbi:hypothetical protein PPTG_11944 [Phytophthora nicotianae INRA-310]|uniref:Integrase catalytic domain-containing protein n=1 Tax=Phytophthora nicotianae (strain INRA-310) TaxID=761204 RepID=W2Q9R3_PHYN3|nr:hypothetical protein PPTG_11944 [Phytophthora nicotianae INRA-310]ETN09616.1 hypothetical protein PPTG_11944 [Phytophthora nicotianae INRA-310]